MKWVWLFASLGLILVSGAQADPGLPMTAIVLTQPEGPRVILQLSDIDLSVAECNADGEFHLNQRVELNYGSEVYTVTGEPNITYTDYAIDCSKTVSDWEDIDVYFINVDYPYNEINCEFNLVTKEVSYCGDGMITEWY